jgi:2'-5' RNA ligase
MKAAIALLADREVQNYARRIVFELEREYHIAFLASLLPAHISLKQPFSFEDMERLEAYLDSLAARFTPFQIELDEIYCKQWSGYSILGLNVRETDMLRGLHNQINRELVAIVRDPSAPHDGNEYRFHMTIELGPVDKTDPYRAYFDRLVDKRVSFTFLAKEIALFYYPDKGRSSFINYKVLELAGQE